VSYVGIDTQGARALGQLLRDTAVQVDGVRRSVSAALNQADLSSQVPAQLALVQDGLTTLGTGITDKAALAEQFAKDPQGTAARLGAPVDALGVAISGLLGFAGPADLRTVLVGLPAPGADPALDAALARLNPVLLPAFQAGQRPELTEAQFADLKLLALALGIEHAGPPVLPDSSDDDERRGFLGLVRRAKERTGTEVFWHDFWTGGRTVDEVLADPALLLEWVAGTFELDRRLALATGLPSLGDVLTSVDFATTGSDSDELTEILAAAETEFAAIADWLPAFLVGQDRTAPDATQLAQTLAFAARVGWPDPGAAAASDQERFADAVAFLRANRAVQSALLPTGFEGDTAPLAFFNESGIGFVLDLGRRTGVLDQTVFGVIADTVDQAMAAFGVDLSGPVPATVTEQFQQQLVALLATQIPRSALQSPAIQAQFIAALGYLRQAATGPEQRQRLIDVLAAFRTLVVTGAPALTERQLVAAVGEKVLDVLGRSRLRLRGERAVRKNPEFLLVARQWGLPGSRKETIGKYKFSWSFNDLGELTGIKRKKRSWLSRAWDTIKAVGKAIWDSWEENPLKAIFQVGKIALGALAFAVPGLQGLGAAAFAVNVAETAFHAIEGDWLSAISSGLAAFTAGATDVFRLGAVPSVLETAQGEFVRGLLDADTLAFLKDAKRAFDIGSSIFRATQADSLVGAIGAGLGAVATTLGGGGQLLRSLDLADNALVADLTRLGLSVADLTRFVGPVAGLAEGGSVLSAFSNGLALLAAGARLVTNPAGAFTGQNPVINTGFQFDRQTQETLRAIAQGSGAAAAVARAIDAAERGDTFLAGTFLAQAVQALNDPRTTVIGSRAQAAERVAEIGVLLEAVFERRASPTAVAPLVVQRLTAVLNALNTPLARQATPGTRRPPQTPAAAVRPSPLATRAATAPAAASPTPLRAASAPVLATSAPTLAFSAPTVASAVPALAFSAPAVAAAVPTVASTVSASGGDAPGFGGLPAGNPLGLAGNPLGLAGDPFGQPVAEAFALTTVAEPAGEMAATSEFTGLMRLGGPTAPAQAEPEVPLVIPVADVSAPGQEPPGSQPWTLSPYYLPPTLMEEGRFVPSEFVFPDLPPAEVATPRPPTLGPDIWPTSPSGGPENLLPVPIGDTNTFTFRFFPGWGRPGFAFSHASNYLNSSLTLYLGTGQGFSFGRTADPVSDHWNFGIEARTAGRLKLDPEGGVTSGVSGRASLSLDGFHVDASGTFSLGDLTLSRSYGFDFNPSDGFSVDPMGVNLRYAPTLEHSISAYLTIPLRGYLSNLPIEVPPALDPGEISLTGGDVPLPTLRLPESPDLQPMPPWDTPGYFPPTLSEEGQFEAPIPAPIDLIPGVQIWQPPWEAPQYFPPTLGQEGQLSPSLPAPADLMPGPQSWQPSWDTPEYFPPTLGQEAQFEPMSYVDDSGMSFDWAVGDAWLAGDDLGWDTSSTGDLYI
jgi:hypothetical protein